MNDPATTPSDAERTARYWGREDLVRVVLDALRSAGKDLDALSADDLAATDQFHGGGRPATLRLAELAGLHEPTADGTPRRVLDVGGGLGGPARTLAGRFGCIVTVIDLTDSYVQVAQELTARVGFSERVTHRVGDALDLPFPDASFDVVWTQNSGMNIADKETLYRGFRRVLRPGGTLAFQEPMAGELSPPHFPVMWADDESMHHVWAPEEVRALLGRLGFVERVWEYATESTSSGNAPPPPPHAVQRLIMGDEKLAAIAAANRRNLDEGRSCTVHAVFSRP
ncbi:MAG: methyltransferase domain-containing protein [Acidimicrobiales bacterium]|nr:methyltransferase domain-containing protein [Acidimicrobiales bacterium]